MIQINGMKKFQTFQKKKVKKYAKAFQILLKILNWPIVWSD